MFHIQIVNDSTPTIINVHCGYHIWSKSLMGAKMKEIRDIFIKLNNNKLKFIYNNTINNKNSSTIQINKHD